MDAQVTRTILDTLVLTANGLLAVGYWLWDHAVVLAVLPLALVVVLLYDRRAGFGAGRRRRRYGRGWTALYSRTATYLPTVALALAWLLVAWSLAFPVPQIGLAMWMTLAILPSVIPLEEEDLARRLKWFIGAYVFGAAVFVVILRTNLSVQALAAWSRMMRQPGGGETLETMAVSSMVPYGVLILWGLGPLVFFGYAYQRIHAYQGSLRSPWKSAEARIAQIVGRGEVG